MKPHKLCTLFPEITGQDFDALVADIRDHGLLNPIITLDGLILDGRNRFNACLKAGVAARFEEFTGTNPLAFVTSQNLNRRHLTEGQKALLAAETATTTRGGARQTERAPLETTVTNAQAAAAFDISERSVRIARMVKQKSPKIAKKLKAGTISLRQAEKAVATPTEPAIPAPTTPTAAPEPATAKNPPISPIEFAKALDSLENRIPNDADHTQFGVLANKLTNRLMNFKSQKTEFNPYA